MPWRPVSSTMAFFEFMGLFEVYRAPYVFGVTFMIGLQALLNMGSFMVFLPAPGLILPLISYDGISLILTLFGVGMLLNISSKS